MLLKNITLENFLKNCEKEQNRNFFLENKIDIKYFCEKGYS